MLGRDEEGIERELRVSYSGLDTCNWCQTKGITLPRNSRETTMA